MSDGIVIGETVAAGVKVGGVPMLEAVKPLMIKTARLEMPGGWEAAVLTLECIGPLEAGVDLDPSQLRFRIGGELYKLTAVVGYEDVERYYQDEPTGGSGSEVGPPKTVRAAEIAKAAEAGY